MQNTTLRPISQIIAITLPPNVDFRPQKQFYTEIGINKHRFAKIIKGEIDPTRTELSSISKYFQISSEDLLS